MSVTPRVMFSWLQPESGEQALVPIAAAMRPREASFRRIVIIVVPLQRSVPKDSLDAADVTLQAKCESTQLLLREETAQLVLPAVRLDREPARMQARRGAPKFNPRPMPREHDLRRSAPVARLDLDLALGHGDRLAVKAPLE